MYVIMVIENRLYLCSYINIYVHLVSQVEHKLSSTYIHLATQAIYNISIQEVYTFSNMCRLTTSLLEHIPLQETYVRRGGHGHCTFPL